MLSEMMHELFVNDGVEYFSNDWEEGDRAVALRPRFIVILVYFNNFGDFE